MLNEMIRNSQSVNRCRIIRNIMRILKNRATKSTSKDRFFYCQNWHSSME